MKKAIVIGGGLAGLSAAVHLARNSCKVTLLEASPKLGGRAYSFFNQKHGHYTDNGQHIMMGCYRHTLELLEITDAMDEIFFQDKLIIHFIDITGKDFYLDASRGIYPFNLLYALMNYKALRMHERFSLLKFFINNILYHGAGSENLTVDRWLERGGQSANAVKAFWEILAVGILNSPLESASASLFRNVLRQIFFAGDKSTKIVFAKNSLSETFAHKGKDFIERHGGLVLLGERITSIEVENGRAVKINTPENSYAGFDFIISALPVKALTKIRFNPGHFKPVLPDLEYSPIISVHLWFKENPFKERFYSLIGSKVHWLFNHGTHITMVASAAGELLSYTNDDIIKYFCLEIQKYFSYFNISEIKDSLVLKEKFATFLATPESNSQRKDFDSPLDNLIFAGDWTDTQIPATIEGAIKSGVEAAVSALTM